MASLTLTIGPITATLTAGDAKATVILTEFAAAIGATGTNQQKANQVVQALVRHMQDVARGQTRQSALEVAAATIQADVDAISWNNGG